MDAFLARIGQQAFNMAVRSGIALTSTLALKKCAQLIKATQDRDDGIKSELCQLQSQLDGRIKIIAPAIDLIELRSTRGNPSLEAALPLATALHQDIKYLAKDLHTTLADMEGLGHVDSRDFRQRKLARIAEEMRHLLNRIDRDIPLLHLAISASGESMSTSLSPGTSPSRFLQASAFLNLGDTQYASNPSRAVQMGPSFTVSLYMLFSGHADLSIRSDQRGDEQPIEPYGIGNGSKQPLWQEVVHKARVRILRTPVDWDFHPSTGFQGLSPSAISQEGFAYHIEIIEDLDDGRFHEKYEFQKGEFAGVLLAGIRESVPIHQISKIFYTDTGRILNVGTDPEHPNNPVLLLKRDAIAAALKTTKDTRLVSTVDVPSSEDVVSFMDNEAWDDQHAVDRQLCEETARQVRSPADISDDLRFPAHLDTEWMALEVFQDDAPDEDSQPGDDGEAKSMSMTRRLGESVPPALDGDKSHGDPASIHPSLLEQMRNICLEDVSDSAERNQPSVGARLFMARSPFAAVTTSLSLLEMLIRLTSLQESQQAHHLTASDPVLNFFLEETSTAKLTTEEGRRRQNKANGPVGYDPSPESISKKE